MRTIFSQNFENMLKARLANAKDNICALKKLT